MGLVAAAIQRQDPEADLGRWARPIVEKRLPEGEAPPLPEPTTPAQSGS
jgi:hypothetical protein